MTDIYISQKGDSRILAPRMLMMYNGRNETLRYDENGRPCFDSAFVSISHSGSLWACALSDAPCGVDIQRKQDVRFDKLASRYFTESEAQEFRKRDEMLFLRYGQPRRHMLN